MPGPDVWNRAGYYLFTATPDRQDAPSPVPDFRSALVAGTTSLTRASIIHDHAPWAPYPSAPPRFARPGPWKLFTADEASAIEAIVDLIIPPDPQTPGGKDAGCATFIDRQLTGPYGSGSGLYSLGPHIKGTKEQGPLSAQTPAELYRKGLASLDQHFTKSFDGKKFAQLSADQQDDLLKKIEPAGRPKRHDGSRAVRPGRPSAGSLTTGK